MKRTRSGPWTAVSVVLLLTTGSVMPPPANAAENPAADGFDLEGSDPEAIALADQVMERLGGFAAWDETRFVTWNFFGRRRHLWDKHTGNIRVEGNERDGGAPYTILMNLHTRQGRAWRDGKEISDPAALSEMLDTGEAAWINDSYWMFMPYKLKDTGVTLKHLGEREMLDGRPAAVLELSFENVGRTPENMYRVYVARDSGLVEQWDFFSDSSDPAPRFQLPWHDWRRYGRILLSANRGESGHTEIAVFDTLPESILTKPDPVEWSSLLP